METGVLEVIGAGGDAGILLVGVYLVRLQDKVSSLRAEVHSLRLTVDTLWTHIKKPT